MAQEKTRYHQTSLLPLSLFLSFTPLPFLALLTFRSASVKNLSRPEKIYCVNPHLMHTLVPHSNPGTLSKTFFLAQLAAARYVLVYPPKGDFLLAFDYFAIGHANSIPLWLISFLY